MFQNNYFNRREDRQIEEFDIQTKEIELNIYIKEISKTQYSIDIKKIKRVKQQNKHKKKITVNLTKTMFRSIPVSNKICFDKQLKRNWRIHQQKLLQMKSSLSKEKTQELTFLEQSKKRNVLKDIENRQIQRSNTILFKKIQEIQKKGNKNSYLQLDRKQRSVPNLSRTLHQPFRKRQLYRIIEQNQQMLKRIRLKKSAYNVRKMEQHRKDVQKNISLISQFKYKNYPATQTKVNLFMTEQKPPITTGSRMSSNHNKTHQDNNNMKSSLTMMTTENGSEQRCKTTMGKGKPRLYKQSCFSQTVRKLNGNGYTITTYLNKGVFYIEVENTENQFDKYRMQMSQQELIKLLHTFYNDSLQSLVQNLDIDPDGQSCYLKLKRDFEAFQEGGQLDNNEQKANQQKN